MRNPKTPQDIENQVERIACNISDGVNRIEHEHRKLVKRMNKLAVMAENTRNPHALIHPDSVDLITCVYGYDEIPIFFPNIFELRRYLQYLPIGEKHRKWIPFRYDEDDKVFCEERIEELKRIKENQP